ncbi:hypothetical protein ACXKZH_21915 [Priestia megaterium]|uniref:hypothetical protein n=1 Tax=Priestia aryabhattai TaxID=412384 RepID=UPI000B162DBE|nr:hypothetical protein [Priestia aryabhattai]
MKPVAIISTGVMSEPRNKCICIITKNEGILQLIFRKITSFGIKIPFSAYTDG